MVEIKDLSLYPLSDKNASYGGAASSKDGILIDDEEWMVKYPKSLSKMEGFNASYSTAPLSEYLGSHIFEILGYEVHQTILGERNDKLVVACKDFATEGKNLLEIRTIKNHTGKELSEILNEKAISSTETHIVNLEELLLHLDKNPVLANIEDIKQRFFEQAIIDIFINNNDRNNGNWGILREKGKSDCIAPIFDNGACFLTKAPEEKLKNLITSEEFINNAINVLTAYGKEGHIYSAKKFLMVVQDIPEFQSALAKVYPLLREKLPTIKEMMDEIPTYHTLKNGCKILVFSDIRKQVYKKQMEIRLEKLLHPQWEKIQTLQIIPYQKKKKQR